MAVLVQRAGELGHAGQPFRPQLVADPGGLRIGGRGGAGQQLDGDMAGRDVGHELPVQRQLAARVGLVPDAPQGGALQHRHRLVRTGA